MGGRDWGGVGGGKSIDFPRFQFFQSNNEGNSAQISKPYVEAVVCSLGEKRQLGTNVLLFSTLLTNLQMCETMDSIAEELRYHYSIELS